MATHRIALIGHLTATALRDTLAPITAAMAGAKTERIELLIDAREMTGYDADARKLFVDWNRERRGTIAQVAILTDNTLWHVVIAAMSLASGQKMRAFRTPDEAQRWLH